MNKLQKLRQLRDRIDARIVELDREMRKSQQEKWELIARDAKNWEWKVIPTVSTPFTGKPQSGLRIEKRINPRVLNQWKEGGFSTFSNDYQEGRWLGMFYFRNEEKIFESLGGGYNILKTNTIISDEEWESMKNGDIPKRLIR